MLRSAVHPSADADTVDLVHPGFDKIWSAADAAFVCSDVREAGPCGHAACVVTGGRARNSSHLVETLRDRFQVRHLIRVRGVRLVELLLHLRILEPTTSLLVERCLEAPEDVDVRVEIPDFL